MNQLDPNSNLQQSSFDAYTADGIPIKPKRCPAGKKKSCCKDTTFAKCWLFSVDVPSCRLARLLFCCKDFPTPGATGVDCQPMQWMYERGRLPRPKQDPPANQFNPLQGVFDLFTFPEPNPSPNPNHCPSPSRH